jgi:hypothetical protein
MRRQAEVDKQKYHDSEVQSADAKNGELLQHNAEYLFAADTECIRLYTDWEIRNSGITCELHLGMFIFLHRYKYTYVYVYMYIYVHVYMYIHV